MADNIYFNSRAKALEAKLLSFEKLTSLANSKTVEEVGSILNESVMLKGVKAENFLDFLQVVKNEENEFLKFLKKNFILQCFFDIMLMGGRKWKEI